VRRLFLLLAVALVAGCGSSSAPAPKGTLTVEIKVIKQGKQVLALVPVTIDGKGPFAFALDTGASQSLIDTAIAKILHAPKTGHTQKIAGITAVANVGSIEVKHWRVGKVQLPATTIVETNLPFGSAHGGVQGLLGSDMLSQFDVITIDYGAGLLRLHRRHG
jgi:hypothetical protein